MKVLSREETKAIFKPENIIGQLVNADAGWNRLFDVPHRKFLRMHIVYHLNVSSIRQDSKRLDTIVVVAMSIISWLIFCVFVLIMGVIGLTLGIVDGREEHRKEDEKDD